MPVFCSIGPSKLLIAGGNDDKKHVMLFEVESDGVVTVKNLGDAPFAFNNGWNNQAYEETPGESILSLVRDEKKKYCLMRIQYSNDWWHKLQFTRLTDVNLC